MARDEDNLAVLLLLCCLVGVVMFLCFSLAAVNLMAAMEDRQEETPSLPSLVEQRQQIIEQRGRARHGQQQRQEEVAYIRGRIAETERKLASLHQAAPTDQTQEIARLRQEIAALEAKKSAFSQELGQKKANLNKFNPWRDLSGSIQFQKPLFIECKAKHVIVHPSRQAFTTVEVNKKDFLPHLTSGCDGIVILVRPNGFSTFDAVFQQARKTGLKLAYEPVDAAWQLDFIREAGP